MKKPTTKPSRKPSNPPQKSANRGKRKRVPEIHIFEFVEDNSYRPTGREIPAAELFKELGL